jgi:hypothetical protein
MIKNISDFTYSEKEEYTQLIVSAVIGLIGDLKPGMNIAISPSEAFQKVKANFGKAANVYYYLAEKLDSNEKLELAKSDSQIINKFPFLRDVIDHSEFLDTANEYLNIVNNFKSFEQEAIKYLKINGIKTNVIEDKFEEINEINKNNYIEYVNNKYKSAFYTNPLNIASIRLVRLLSFINNTNGNKFGMKLFIKIDDIIEDIFISSSKLEVVNLENLNRAIYQKTIPRPYLKYLLIKLNKIRKENNYQLLNEIVTFANKIKNENKIIIANDNGESLDTIIIETNRENPINKIIKEWINKEADINNEIIEKFNIVRKSKDVNAKKQWVKDFFDILKLGFTNEMIEGLFNKANEGIFRKKGGNSNFEALFNKSSTFWILIDAYTELTKIELNEERVIKNIIKNEKTTFKILAEIFFEYSPGKYNYGYYRNSDQINNWTFILPSYYDIINKKIKNEQYLNRILKKSFSRSSDAIKKLKESIETNNKTFVLNFEYCDGIKINNKYYNELTKKGEIIDAYLKHQNQNFSTGYYDIFSLEYNINNPLVNITKEIIKYDSDFVLLSKESIEAAGGEYNIVNALAFKNNFKDKLYNLVESEINRMQDYVKMLEENPENKLNIASFETAFKLFYLFPVLNKDRYKKIVNKIHNGEELDAGDITEIKEAVTQSFKLNVIKSFTDMMEMGLIKKQDFYNGNGNITYEYTFPFFDSKYMISDTMYRLTSYEKGIQAIVDYNFNNLRAKITTLQIFKTDIALFQNISSDLILDKLQENEKLEIVEKANINFQNSFKYFTNHGIQGSMKWLDENKEIYEYEMYSAVIFKNYNLSEKIIENSSIEYITIQEHINRLFSKGLISDEVWNSIKNKIDTSIKNGTHYYELSKLEFESIYRKEKYTYVYSNKINTHFDRFDIIETNTKFLLPESEIHSEKNKLRIWMEKNNIQSAINENSVIIGNMKKAIQLFNSKGEFSIPRELKIEEYILNLDRQGMFNQNW